MHRLDDSASRKTTLSWNGWWSIAHHLRAASQSIIYVLPKLSIRPRDLTAIYHTPKDNFGLRLGTDLSLMWLAGMGILESVTNTGVTT